MFQNDDNVDPSHDMNAIDFRRASLVPGSGLLQRSNSMGSSNWKSVRDKVVSRQLSVSRKVNECILQIIPIVNWTIQGISIRPLPGCENAAGKLRQKR